MAHQSGAGQTNWRWCSNCQGMWFANNPAQSRCPAGGTHTSAGSGDYHLVQVTTTVRVHVKVLTSPAVAIETMFHNMREVYAAGEIDVEWVTTETLNLPLLNDCNVGTCMMGQTSPDQNQLFANRHNVGPNDMVVYFVRTTVPPSNGCAAHPAGWPGAVVAQGATQWTLAHEIGHVLGLSHVNDNDRLMTGNGTSNITKTPPDLVPMEIAIMVASPLTVNV